jgi:hypothetical protein
MKAINRTEVRAYRAKAAFLQSAVLLATAAGIAVIGTTAPAAQGLQPVAANCANDREFSVPASETSVELANLCPPGGASAQAATGHAVPDAGASLDPAAEAEPLPPTF